jgi:hypothetical protein
MNTEEGKKWDSKKMTTIRWTVVLVYLVLVMTIAFLPVAIEELMDEAIYTALVMIVTVGGSFAIIAVLLSPYFIGQKGPVVPDGMAVDTVWESFTAMPPYVETMRFSLMIYVMVPMIILFAILTLVFMSFEMVLIMGVTIAFLLALLVIFGTLEVKCDNKELHFHFGPIGKKIPIDDIVSIRPTSVHALRDFMGYGLRVGPDGTIGYIIGGNVGVRISLKDKKEYVVTIPNPQDLVNYVRMVRKRPRK